MAQPHRNEALFWKILRENNMHKIFVLVLNGKYDHSMASSQEKRAILSIRHRLLAKKITSS